MKKYPKILIGTPTYEGKEYCRERFVKNLQILAGNYPNCHWVILDNTKHNRYCNKLKRLYPGHVHKTPRGNNSRDALANASNWLRHKAIKEDYDYLLMVESDLFPPKDTIPRLLRHGKPVVGLPYEIGFNEARGLCIFVTEKQGEGMLGTRRLHPHECEAFMTGELKQIHGMGVGCVLIHRSILEKYPFWYSTADDERMKDQTVRKHPDVYFYLDLHNDKIPVFCDTSVLVYHENSNWELVKDV